MARGEISDSLIERMRKQPPRTGTHAGPTTGKLGATLKDRKPKEASTIEVTLAADVAARFPNSDSVNKALRELIRIADLGK